MALFTGKHSAPTQWTRTSALAQCCQVLSQISLS
jgi:hypothetical protein